MASSSSTPDNGLWEKLQRFQLDDASCQLTFSQRLARENDWSLTYAVRVTEEYKRFVYLAMVSGHQVTPSDEVDQAWHLHLTYTHSYWDEMCGDVLGKPLHHGPTKGGQAEGERFELQYIRTLASYIDAFGHVPPDDIWPTAKIRFGEAANWIRVNRGRTWVVPKPWRAAGGRPAAIAGALVCFIPSFAAGATWNPFNFNGPQFLMFYTAVCGMSLVIAYMLRNLMSSQQEYQCPDSLKEDPELIALLRGGWQAAFQAAMSGLVAEKAIDVKSKTGFFSNTHTATRLRAPVPSDSDIQKRILSMPTKDNTAELSALGKRAKVNAKERERELEQAGLLETEDGFRSARTSIRLVLGCAFAIGALKLAIGLFRGRPVGYLLMMLVILAAATLFFTTKPRRTRAGNRVLAELRDGNRSLKSNLRNKAAVLSADEAMLAVGLFGLAGCRLDFLMPLSKAISQMPGDQGGLLFSGSSKHGDTGCSDGGSGGCGGGGCGGGCGGCGG